MNDDAAPPAPGTTFAGCNAPFDECTVSLALYSLSLDPAAVSLRLGCKPTSAFRKGDRRSPRARPLSCGSWLLEEEATKPTRLDDLVSRLLDRLPSDPEVWAELRRDYQVQIRFAFQASTLTGCFEIDPATARRLAATGATLAFHLYSWAGD